MALIGQLDLLLSSSVRHRVPSCAVVVEIHHHLRIGNWVGDCTLSIVGEIHLHVELAVLGQFLTLLVGSHDSGDRDFVLVPAIHAFLSVLRWLVTSSRLLNSSALSS